MGRTVSDEELQLRKRARRRLIGAIALVTAVVVLLPMVLDSEPKPAADHIAIQIPPKDNAGNFASKVTAAVEAPVAGTKAAGAAKPAVQADAAAAQSASPTVPDAAKPRSEPNETPKSQAKPATAPEKSNAESKPQLRPEPRPEPRQEARSVVPAYVVQLGAFSNLADAKQQQDKLSANGIGSYTETVKTAKGELTRVRTGPYATREAAEKARDQLKKMGLNGVVTAK